MEEKAAPTTQCLQCGLPVPADAASCTSCGYTPSPLAEIDEEAGRSKWLRILGIFYAIDLLVCTVVNFMDYFRGLEWLMLTEGILAGLTLIFVLFLRKEISPLLGWKDFSFPKALVYCGAAVVFAIAVNIIIKWLNQRIFDQDIYFYLSFRHLPYPKLAMVTVVALLPAVFEELGYRGVILQCLGKVVDQRQAILISAFLFAIIHMSFISFFWLIPFAIWLGNVRVKEKTLWYGILIHFCFNITACLFEFYELKVF